MSEESTRRRTINTKQAVAVFNWMQKHREELHLKTNRKVATEQVLAELNIRINSKRLNDIARGCDIKLLRTPREPHPATPEPLPVKNRTMLLAQVMEYILRDAEQQLGLKTGTWGRSNGARKNLLRICRGHATQPTSASQKSDLNPKIAAKQAPVAEDTNTNAASPG